MIAFTRTTAKYALALLIAICTQTVCLAVDQSTAKIENQLLHIDPQPLEGVPSGKGAIFTGSVDGGGHHFYLDNLNMTVPVSITLMNRRDGDVLKLALAKVPWGDPIRVSETNASEMYVNQKLRTQGEVLISVSSPQPNTPYELVVWVGDEVKPALQKVIVSKSEYETHGAKNALPSAVIWGGIGLLAGAVLVMATILIVRRKNDSQH